MNNATLDPTRPIDMPMPRRAPGEYQMTVKLLTGAGIRSRVLRRRCSGCDTYLRHDAPEMQRYCSNPCRQRAHRRWENEDSEVAA